MKRSNTTHNSTNRILALGVALTIGVWLVILFTGQQTEEHPTTAQAPPAPPEGNEEAKVIGGGDAAAEFRERHNRALSPEAREDHRRKLWEQNFPWQPTYDSANTVTAEMISASPRSRWATDTHFYLKKFFDNELRFSPQFEQLCRIMEEYDRTENPVALARAFDTLREYHRILREENLEELVRNSDGTPVRRRVRGELITLSDGSRGWEINDEWETFTHREDAESMKSCLASAIAGERHWPHQEMMSYDESIEVVERLISEIHGWEDVNGWLVMASGAHRGRKTLKVGDPLLTPYAGYQAGFDAWNDERNRQISEGMAKKRRKNRPAGILADGTLVNASGEPIQAGAGSFGSFVNFGENFSLQEMDDGSVRLSPEAMAVLDAEFGKQERPLRPAVLGNPPPTDEEWRLQEALRQQDEEGARHQQRHLEELCRQRQQE